MKGRVCRPHLGDRTPPGMKQAQEPSCSQPACEQQHQDEQFDHGGLTGHEQPPCGHASRTAHRLSIPVAPTTAPGHSRSSTVVVKARMSGIRSAPNPIS
jgi:hypothetical protein